MASTSGHSTSHPPQYGHYVHDSEETSDSNEEFASASEGDDELPWEPIVTKSPIIARQSHLHLNAPEEHDQEHDQEQAQIETPRPAHSTARPMPEQPALQHQHQNQAQQQLQTQTHVDQQHRPESAQVSQQQQHHGYHEQHYQQQHQYHNQQHHDQHQYHQNQPARHDQQHRQLQPQPQRASIHEQSYRSSDPSATTTSHFQQQSHSQSFSSSSYSYSQTHQQVKQHSSSSSTSSLTRSQHSSSQTLSHGSTPKLRERMRQSPVLYSKVVQAYLDPNSSAGQYQQLTPEHVRQAWLQDVEQESSEDDFEDEAGQSVDQRVPKYVTPVRDHREPSVPISAPAPPTVTPSNFVAYSMPDLQNEDASWGFDDEINVDEVQESTLAGMSQGFNDKAEVEETQQTNLRETSWEFDDRNVVDDTVPSDQVETSWGFDDQLEIEEPASDFPTHQAQDSATTQQEEHPNTQYTHEDVEDAWDYDDQLMDLAETAVQTAPQSAEVTIDQDRRVSIGGDGGDDAEIGEPMEPSNPFASSDDHFYAEQESSETSTLSTINQDHVEPSLVSEGLHHSEADQLQSIASDVPRSTTNQDAMEELAEATKNDTDRARLEHDFDNPTEAVHGTHSSDIGVENAESSWGFDMDEDIDIEVDSVQEEALSSEYSYDQERSLNGHQHHELGASLGTISSSDGQEKGLESFAASATPHADTEPGHITHGSDNEHDSEVREVLRAARSNPFVKPEDNHHTEPTPVALSSAASEQDHLQGSSTTRNIDSEGSIPASLQIAVESKVKNVENDLYSQVPDTLPESTETDSLESATRRTGPSSVAQDSMSVASDSESSDLYGDLSTARSGMNASSNRLNEILDDDDYLEHMERGVPMNRSISTPYSDDESPKFIVDDEDVELMERGEPRPLDGTSVARHEALSEDETEAAPSNLEDDLGLSNLSAASTSLVAISDDARIENSAHEVFLQENMPFPEDAVDGAIPTSATSLPHHDNLEQEELKLGAELTTVPQESIRTRPEHDAGHTYETVAEHTSECEDKDLEETIAGAMDDDQDPANPFSDAAAIDDQDAWQSSYEPPTGIQKSEADEDDQLQESVQHSEPESQNIIETGVAPAKEVDDGFAQNTDETLEEDAWADLDMSIVVEPALAEQHPLTDTSVHEEPSSVYSAVEAQSHFGRAFDSHIDDNIEASTKEDAWADQDMNIVVESTTTEEYPPVDIPGKEKSSRDYSVFLEHDAQNQPERTLGNDFEDTVEASEQNDAWIDQEVNTIMEPTPVEASVADDTSAHEEPSGDDPAPKMLDAQNHSVHTLDTNLEGTIESGPQKDAWDENEEDLAFDAEPAPSATQGDKMPAAHFNEVETHRDDDGDAVHANLTISAPVVGISLQDFIDTALEQEDAWRDDFETNSEIAPGHVQEAVSSEDLYEHQQGHINDLIPETTAAGAISGRSGDVSVAPDLDADAIDESGQSNTDQEAKLAVVTDMCQDDRHDALSLQGAEINTQELVQSITDGDVVNAIDAAVEEDMWGDQDLDINSEDFHAAPTPFEQDHVKHRDHTGNIDLLEGTAVESDHQSVLPAAVVSVTTPGLSWGEPTAELDLEEALGQDAWGEQDGDASVDQVHTIPTTSSQRADTFHLPVHSAHFTSAQESSKEEEVQESAQPFSTNEDGTSVSVSSRKVEPIIPESQIEKADDLNEDAWGWDEDDVDVDPKLEKEGVRSSKEKFEVSEGLGGQAFAEPQEVSQTNKGATPEESKTMAAPEEATPHALLAMAAVISISDKLSPLTIQNEPLSLGTGSGEGDEDSPSQSPWQDVSPASVSKRSEAGVSVGSELESEYSIRSLDEYERVSPGSERGQFHGRDRSSGSISSESRRGMGSTMSWTDLNQDDWHTDAHGDVVHDENTKERTSLTASFNQKSKDIVASSEISELPDISGADSWDFDQDDDVHIGMPSFIADQTSISTRTESSRNLKTPDISEHDSAVQHHTSNYSSPSSGSRLSFSQLSVAGSSPTLLGHHQAQPSAPISTSSTFESLSSAEAAPDVKPEVEDDSHLPLAIRQQRARLAAKGKPLPPISKYKSTKGTPNVDQSATTTVSPRISATTSPVISFTSPVKTPVSPMSNAATTPTDQKYLTPALQKQRERLEQKRASASPLGAVRRLTVTEPSAGHQPLQQQQQQPSVLQIASPRISQATLPSALKHTLKSPTMAKKMVHLSDTHEASTPLSFDESSAKEVGQTSRYRRSSVSHGSPTPILSPSILAEGFVRRNKDGSRPKPQHSAENQESDIVRTSQSDAYRYGSRISTSSSRSGWDDFGDVDENAEVESTMSAGRKDFPPKQPATTELSSTSSSSFYQQTVPGLDDDHVDRFGGPSTVSGSGSVSGLGTSSTSLYLSNSKVDEYDPYGPMANRSNKSKARNSTDEGEVLIDRSKHSPSVSLLSPTSAGSMSHRHDHGSSASNNNSSLWGGGGGSGSLVGDITGIVNEKKMAGPGGISNNGGRNDKEDSNKKPTMSSTGASSNLQKSSSWSLGSWVSSAVAVATETIDKAYETLDPEYSRMKSRGGTMTSSGDGSVLSDSGMDDPDSLSPYKKPGYLVG
ncbi:hypothetical protein BGZ54_010098, partial [Gamsiella multidivaricata]